MKHVAHISKQNPTLFLFFFRVVHEPDMASHFLTGSFTLTLVL
jgi:hypothetical protein